MLNKIIVTRYINDLVDLFVCIFYREGADMTKMTRKLIHPGIVFYEDVMKPLDLSVTKTAQILGVSRKALSEFINGKSSLSPDMALRISIATGTSAESWMNMQQKLTLWLAEQNVPGNVEAGALKRDN